MPIEVGFRGPCLFVMKDRKRVAEVLLPNARDFVPDGGQPGQHADGTAARRHWAALAVIGLGPPRPRIVERVPLHGRQVRFGDASGGAKLDAGVRRTLVPLNEVTNGPDAGTHLVRREPVPEDFGGRLAARILLGDGRIVAPEEPSILWSFDERFTAHGHKDVPLSAWPTWEAPGESVDVTVTDAGGAVEHEFVVGPGHRVVVYNADREAPALEDLDFRAPCAGRLEDHDFKWLYLLLRPRQGSWAEWLRGGPLPAPVTECGRAAPDDAASWDAITGGGGGARDRGRTRRAGGALRAPSVSTCYGSGWDD